MFRSSTIIRELALDLAKVIFMLKHSVKLRRYLLCGCVAACCHTTLQYLFPGLNCAVSKSMKFSRFSVDCVKIKLPFPIISEARNPIQMGHPFTDIFFCIIPHDTGSMRWRSLLIHFDTSQKDACSIGIFLLT
jgi:hypothetical protein